MAAITMLAVCILSCQKKNDVVNAEAAAKTGADSTARSLLKEWTRDGRTYHFHYDRMGYIDSVVAVGPGSNTYTYRITHQGKYIDSSSLWQNGQLISSKKNVGYDLLGRVTNFDYQLHVYPAPPRQYQLTYNAQGDVYTMEVLDQAPVKDTFGYSADHGLRLRDSRSSGATFISTYTNDAGSNPLRSIDGLVIFTEEGFHDLWFNGRNVIRQVSLSPQTGTTDYVNLYDPSGRIISSTGTGYSPRTMTFTYY
jgi:hypothetical protein